MNAIKLQEQDGTLATITPGKDYIRPPGAYYPMNPAKLPHGIALIISNKKFAKHEVRDGTEKDVQNLRKAFQYLGYEVLICRDCTSVEMEGFFEPGGLIFQKAKQEHDSFVCCILSHGNVDNVFGADSKPVNVSQLNGIQFKLARCALLLNKSKLFFIQACPWEDLNSGIKFDSGDRIASDFTKLPTKADYYISYSTVQGEKSTCHMDHGSRYVLEQHTEQHAQDCCKERSRVPSYNHPAACG